MSDYILMVQLDVPDEHVEDFNRLYDTEHVPYLAAVPGVTGAQRYELDSNAEDQLRYLAIYELERPEIPLSKEWEKAATAPAWLEVRQHINARRRGVFRKM